jgi:hypothetical protein
MTARCLHTAIVIGFILSSSSAFAQHTYYISKSVGSDSNTSTQAQSKSAPWAHIPGQAGCASQCAAYTPVAGDRFIFKGGDTWVASDLGITWLWSGTSGSKIYIGVDQSWFTGASWTRPKFDCQNTQCSQHNFGGLVWIQGQWVIFDNIEFTGFSQTGSGYHMVEVYASNTEVENCYFHGWTRPAGSISQNSFAYSDNFGEPGGGINNKFHDNVIDGADATNNDFFGGIYHGYEVYNNVIRYIYNGLNGSFKHVHGNLIENNVDAQTGSGDHCNMVRIGGITGGEPSTLWVYNNIVRNAGCMGGSNLYAIADDTCTSCVTYVYNNILYNNPLSFDPAVTIGGHQNSGTYWYWNNTIQSTGPCFTNGDTNAQGEIAHYQNNHCIQPSGSVICSIAVGSCINDGGNLTQTAAQADANNSPHFDQYTASETYAYSPVASTNSTVGAGNNLTSSCIGNLAALCSDMAYASYDTVNHKVVIRTVNARPTSGAWDLGMYQYSNLVSQAPQSPTNLQIVVQ